MTKHGTKYKGVGPPPLSAPLHHQTNQSRARTVRSYHPVAPVCLCSVEHEACRISRRPPKSVVLITAWSRDLQPDGWTVVDGDWPRRALSIHQTSNFFEQEGSISTNRVTPTGRSSFIISPLLLYSNRHLSLGSPKRPSTSSYSPKPFELISVDFATFPLKSV